MILSGDELRKHRNEDAFAEDAKRLAELREERERLWPTDTARSDINAVRLAQRERELDSLIAIYEECQARGRLFGGLR